MGAHRQDCRRQVVPRPLIIDRDADTAGGPRVARVLADVPAIEKQFDYLVPEALRDQVRVGAIVRINLHGRRVGGWVLALDPPDAHISGLKPIAKVTGLGPPPELLALSAWAAWRWAGRRTALLRTASPPRAVPALPTAPRLPLAGVSPETTGPGHPAAVARAATEALGGGVRVLRLPPATSQMPVLRAAAARGDALVVAPSLAGARRAAEALRRDGFALSLVPDQWAGAAAGGVVVGARAAAWAPVRELAAVVVLDEHDEVHKEERAPTWHARDVAVERAQRVGVPCALVSPVPSLEALQLGPLVTLPRDVERAGWPLVDLIDRRNDEQPGLYSSPLVERLRDAQRSAVVLNRKGRAVLLACAACDELARCDKCGGACRQADTEETSGGALRCRRCDAARPVVCSRCGATKLKNLRAGVTRVREELEALLRRRVVEVTGATARTSLPEAYCYVGTEAVLHQVRGVDVVAFLEFDQELLAPRYRAAEESLALLARAARLVGPRARGGRVVVQTRLPGHEVLEAAVRADPTLVSDVEVGRRAALGWPPAVAMAAISGEAATAYVDALRASATAPALRVLGPADDRWLVTAADHRTLCNALATVPRTLGRLRIDVDPLRV